MLPTDLDALLLSVAEEIPEAQTVRIGRYTSIERTDNSVEVAPLWDIVASIPRRNKRFGVMKGQSETITGSGGTFWEALGSIKRSYLFATTGKIE